MFKVVIVDSIAGASELEKLLGKSWKIAQTNEFDAGVVYILIEEKTPVAKA